MRREANSLPFSFCAPDGTNCLSSLRRSRRHERNHAHLKPNRPSREVFCFRSTKMRREATASRFHFVRLTERTASVRPAARGGTSECEPEKTYTPLPRSILLRRDQKIMCIFFSVMWNVRVYVEMLPFRAVFLFVNFYIRRYFFSVRSEEKNRSGKVENNSFFAQLFQKIGILVIVFC